ncbi:MAG: bifunctional phosphopantothenoylcysteine decarboxylase/phosphopantothenate--cysteine ligase CoaBC [Saprospiraceae bacterium]|nr:bifunctional phosphopantothenoylcysteine decarboxylase/phosphopantothenate--cysteine ligase CoaBC [Saprospiraceae bacterium]
MLSGKKVIIAVTGSIAAYKSLLLVRQLKKEGCEVKVIMSPAASHFVSPLSFSTLSGEEVAIELFEGNSWNNHVEMGMWADVMVIAPATANTLAKAANGMCDNLVMAVYLSAKCPVVFCPAMDLDMYKHPATIANLNKIKSFGNHIIDAKYGELASGLVGEGRLAEPEEIVTYLGKFLSEAKVLSGKSFIVTAGPTFEALDPVRFIGNHSSGKMGVAIANRLAELGGNVTLILGPSSVNAFHSNVNVVRCVSADEMYVAAKEAYPGTSAVVFAAAVADYKPAFVADQKIKKSDAEFALSLVKNVDIAFELGKLKNNNTIHVGFALETENEEENATKKIHKKNFDFLVLNSLNDSGAGFKHDTNKIKIIDKNGVVTPFPLKSKDEVAADIVNALLAKL